MGHGAGFHTAWRTSRSCATSIAGGQGSAAARAQAGNKNALKHGRYSAASISNRRATPQRTTVHAPFIIKRKWLKTYDDIQSQSGDQVPPGGIGLCWYCAS
jgi:hypothetical protein